jgi:hypothetical protein
MSVVVGAKGQAVGFFPVGGRALIALGTSFWGYASPKHAPVHDEHVGDGLPTPRSAATHLQAVGGLWPDIAVVTGEKELAEYAGARSVLFLERQGVFTASKAAFDDVPRLAATSKGVTYLFVPDGMYFIGGLDVARCAQQAPADLPVLAIRGDQKLARPLAAASFHPQALATDASGGAFVVGADHCHPGAFIASLDASPLKPELVPGSDACTERTNVEGMPFTHAYLFPAASGGFYVLLANVAASTYYPDEAKARTGACAAPPRVVQRLANGVWSAARAVPDSPLNVDPSGTVWTLTDHHTVLRVSETGDRREIALDPSCLHPPSDPTLAIDDAAGGIVGLFVPFPDQPWIKVAYKGDRTGLCAANAN